MSKKIQGRALCFGNNIDTDIICPGRFLELSDPYEIASHAMCGIDPDFSSRVKKGDIIVAGRNFGCGSSREHGVIAIKYSGVQAVVAESIAKIYYRNAIVEGLLVIICPEALSIFEDEDPIEIELETGIIKNLRTGESVQGEKLTQKDIEIWEKGGMIQEYKEKAKELRAKLGS